MKTSAKRLIGFFACTCLAIGRVVADGEPGDPPFFISGNYAEFRVGAPNQFIIDVGGSPPPSLSFDGQLPPGVTFQDNGNGTATLAGGLAGDGGFYLITVYAQNDWGEDQQDLYIDVYEPTTITSADHATFTGGEPGLFTVTTAGGSPEVTSITLTGGSLPAGLTFSNDFGTAYIQGVPAEGTAGIYNLQIVAHSDAGDTVQDFTLTINPVPPGTPAVPRPAGLVGWWTADGNAIDHQNDNNGTLNGGATFTAGKVNRAFQFNGSTAYVAMGNPGALKARAVTIEAWVKPTILPANGQMMAIATKWNNNSAKTSVGDAYGLFLINNGGTLQLRAGINPTWGAELNLQGGNLSLNQWSHVAVAYQNEGGIFRLYVNGVLAAQAGDSGFPIFASDVNVMIGRQNDNTTPRYFTGLIDEVSIYDRALTTIEISNIYHARENGKLKMPPSVTPPVNLLAWFPADGSTLDLQQDRQVDLPAGATFAPGMVGQAFDLYGANAGIEIPSDPAWNFGTEQFTIATWIRFASPDSYQLIATHEQVGVGLGWRFMLNGFTLQFQLPGGNNAGVSPFNPVAQQWYHLAVTRNGSTYRFYIDGVQFGGDQTNAGAIPARDGPLTLGYSNGFPSMMHGRIDEFQIVHRALSSQEIAAIYQTQNSGETKSFTLYVTNPGTGTVTQLEANGSATPFATGLANPLGIALDARGDVHVAENGTSRILKFTGPGSASPWISPISDPHGIAFDAYGDFFAASRSLDNIAAFDAAGAPLGSVPGGPATLRAPTGLAFDHLNHLHVSNQGNDTIATYDSVSWSLGSASTLLHSPGGLDFGPAGNLRVANSASHSIVETDATGTGTAFAGVGLNQPRDLVSDAAGNLYVTDAATNTVKKIDPAGTVTTFATLPAGSAPAFIALRQRSTMTPHVQVNSFHHTAGGPAVIHGQSRPNALVTIRATTDLATPAQTVGETTADGTGAFQFIDHTASGFSRRFYIAYW